MPRIVYYSIATGPNGGHKMILRHVEALNELGFDAVVMEHTNSPSRFVEHRATVVPRGRPGLDDIVVLSEDAFRLLSQTAISPHRLVVFCQNHFYGGIGGLLRLPPDLQQNCRCFMAVSDVSARWVRRYFPWAQVYVVPAFADERMFRPGSAKSPVIAYAPRKRPSEADLIRRSFLRRRDGERWRDWARLEDATEAEVAATLGRAAVFLSLARLEGLGITALEAMASGCLTVGFTGIGGREFATAGNGFWAEEDDCEQVVEDLLRATALFDSHDTLFEATASAGWATAAGWSYARFREALGAFWTGYLAENAPG